MATLEISKIISIKLKEFSEDNSQINLSKILFLLITSQKIENLLSKLKLLDSKISTNNAEIDSIIKKYIQNDLSQILKLCETNKTLQDFEIKKCVKSILISLNKNAFFGSFNISNRKINMIF